MKSEAVINDLPVRRAAVSRRVPAWVMPAIKGAVMIVDGLIAIGSFLLAFKLREGSDVLSQTAWAWSRDFVPYAGILYFAVAARVAMLLYQRAYNYVGSFSYAQEVIKIFKIGRASCRERV